MRGSRPRTQVTVKDSDLLTKWVPAFALLLPCPTSCPPASCCLWPGPGSAPQLPSSSLYRSRGDIIRQQAKARKLQGGKREADTLDRLKKFSAKLASAAAVGAPGGEEGQQQQRGKEEMEEQERAYSGQVLGADRQLLNPAAWRIDSYLDRVRIRGRAPEGESASAFPRGREGGAACGCIQLRTDAGLPVLFLCLWRAGAGGRGRGGRGGRRGWTGGPSQPQVQGGQGKWLWGCIPRSAAALTATACLVLLQPAQVGGDKGEDYVVVDPRLEEAKRKAERKQGDRGQGHRDRR